MTDNQKAFLKALESSLGIVSAAAEMSGLDRTNHYKWIESSEEYRLASLEIVKQPAKDFVKSALFKLVENGNPAAVIYACKVLLRDEGFGDVVEHKGQGKEGEIVFRLDYGNTDADPSGH